MKNCSERLMENMDFMRHKVTNALTIHTSKYSQQDMQVQVFHLLHTFMNQVSCISNIKVHLH